LRRRGMCVLTRRQEGSARPMRRGRRPRSRRQSNVSCADAGLAGRHPRQGLKRVPEHVFLLVLAGGCRPGEGNNVHDHHCMRCGGSNFGIIPMLTASVFLSAAAMRGHRSSAEGLAGPGCPRSGRGGRIPAGGTGRHPPRMEGTKMNASMSAASISCAGLGFAAVVGTAPATGRAA
jgi:hypothetical protein